MVNSFYIWINLMKHHRYHPGFKFIKDPVEFNKYTEKHLLQYCLGATLYMPGTREFAQKILNRQVPDLTSMVMCFEDAIREEDLGFAEDNVIKHLDIISAALKNKVITHNDIPLIFLRVRNPEQFKRFSKRLTSPRADVLSGFVFPKFYSSNGHDYFRCLESINRDLDVMLYGMPILEGSPIALLETRIDELMQISNILIPYKKLVLNIRVGGTDFSSIFGVRRGIDYSIYDILTVRDCLSDILNFFSRDGLDYTISAPVWEYFLASKQDDIDCLMEEGIHRSLLKRNRILNEAIDGLLREVVLDKANGFVGKTVIHPSHLKYVNAMQAVTKEEYDDAIQVLDTSDGVVKSTTANKMNEINPHRNWAKKIMTRAQAFGVVEDEASYFKLFLG
jgi:citrate lyase beta subunit